MNPVCGNCKKYGVPWVCPHMAPRNVCPLTNQKCEVIAATDRHAPACCVFDNALVDEVVGRLVDVVLKND